MPHQAVPVSICAADLILDCIVEPLEGSFDCLSVVTIDEEVYDWQFAAWVSYPFVKLSSQGPFAYAIMIRLWVKPTYSSRISLLLNVPGCLKPITKTTLTHQLSIILGARIGDEPC